MLDSVEKTAEYLIEGFQTQYYYWNLQPGTGVTFTCGDEDIETHLTTPNKNIISNSCRHCEFAELSFYFLWDEVRWVPFQKLKIDRGNEAGLNLKDMLDSNVILTGGWDIVTKWTNNLQLYSKFNTKLTVTTNGKPSDVTEHMIDLTKEIFIVDDPQIAITSVRPETAGPKTWPSELSLDASLEVTRTCSVFTLNPTRFNPAWKGEEIFKRNFKHIEWNEGQEQWWITNGGTRTTKTCPTRNCPDCTKVVLTYKPHLYEPLCKGNSKFNAQCWQKTGEPCGNPSG